MALNENYPLSSPSSLKSQFLGKKLADLPTPSIILDRALVRRHCAEMQRVCGALGIGFRAHVKSHKTTEVSRYMVGDGLSWEGKEGGHEGPANFIVSTVAEAEHLAPFVRGEQARGREASILYGVPVPPSSLPRLLALAASLQPKSILLMLDSPATLTRLLAALATTPTPTLGLFVKVDTGYHRAGLAPESPSLAALIAAILQSEQDGQSVELVGLYSHLGSSYANSSPQDAASGLATEFAGLESALRVVPAPRRKSLVLSVGATPTVAAAQNLASGSGAQDAALRQALDRVKALCRVEVHAGVYPLLDCQQVATGARGARHADIAVRVLLEVSSVYGERERPEVLVSGGSLALGREPCKSYSGWGIVEGSLGNEGAAVFGEGGAGWVVGRVSQEHGVLLWEGDVGQYKELRVGDKVAVWPNHACIAGVGFGWYLVVDSELGGDEVVDVWVRWRGW
ncbi:hypothetical protein C7974DRAFT_450768 [Boeremia exigua]|uniref:uncharacterized protein n=1 Tax=Boeremia exigua TaxID=749465 RepID=UPI001E8DE840|nr:uncharacterized protein C7974DRAFT_450768 [Boeremia exigua]KAH6637747.1 hypothetical protein C7974DRAFT_450768 [Boeremia exigua]